MILTHKPTQEEIQKRKEGTHPREIRVCNGKTCTRNNSKYLMTRIEDMYQTKAGQVTDRADLNYCPCQGHCEYGPNVRVNGEILMKAQVFKLKERIENSMQNPGADEMATSEKLMAEKPVAGIQPGKVTSNEVTSNGVANNAVNKSTNPLADILGDDFLGDL